MKHTDETKKKISDGVKRHYQNMSKAANEKRKQRIAQHRHTEHMALRFIQSHKDVIKRVLDEIGKIAEVTEAEEEFSFFRSALTVFDDESFSGKVRVDFSVTGDRNYYNGLIFKGFVAGLPAAILSGGQYDNLMGRLGKRAEAAGFAVYLDSLEQLDETPSSPDFDIVLIYGEDIEPRELMSAVEGLQSEGATVRTSRSGPSEVRAGKTGVFEKGGITWQE